MGISYFIQYESDIYLRESPM